MQLNGVVLFNYIVANIPANLNWRGFKIGVDVGLTNGYMVLILYMLIYNNVI